MSVCRKSFNAIVAPVVMPDFRFPSYFVVLHSILYVLSSPNFPQKKKNNFSFFALSYALCSWAGWLAVVVGIVCFAFGIYSTDAYVMTRININ